MMDNVLTCWNDSPFDGADGPWQPILEGALKERALGAIQDIAHRLHTPSYDLGDLPESLRRGAAANLSNGDAGLAVLYAYLSQVRSQDDDDVTALQFLKQAIDAVSLTPMPAKLHGGFTGVAWAVSHLSGWLVDAEENDPNQAIDDALLKLLSQSPWTGEYDLIGGLAGFGVYALERLPHPTAVKCLERVIDHLDETAERSPEGITWLSPPGWLMVENPENFGRGLYVLGVAHGVSGVIALLGRACAAGIALVQARSLLDGAVSWLLAQQPEHRAMGFPYWVTPGVVSTPARLAWCYGDPGIAAALLCAARCVGEPTWERESLAIARRAAERPPEQAGTVDPGLCHGTAGLGHLFNRMFQATGEAWLKQAAVFWFERTLEMRRPAGGIGGFSALDFASGEERWVDDPGLLTGAAGIALALLAAITAVEPA